MNKGRQAAMLLASCLALACSIDDRMLTVVDGSGGIGNPPPSTDVVIDTFEQDTILLNGRGATVEDPRFFGWKVERLDETSQGSEDGHLSIVETTGRDGHVLQLDWQVLEIPDGIPQHPGTSLELSLNSDIDLSPYASLVFAHRYDHQGTCQPVPLLTVAVVCSSDRWVETFTPLSAAWTATTIPFTELQDAGTRPVTREECLSSVQMFAFKLQVSLADGDCASGTLWLDDVALRY